jgi:hypothetical protein
MPDPRLQSGYNDTCVKPPASYNQFDEPERQGADMHIRGITSGRRRAGPLTAGMIALGLFAAACNKDNAADPTVARLSGSAASATSSASESAHGSLLAYSRCMRSHGIKDFPDPSGNGDLGIQAGPGSDLNPKNPQVAAADRSCRPLLPNHGQPPPGAKQAALKYAQCMRSHGISDFPDPQADGRLTIGGRSGSDLNPDNPQFKRADQACNKYMPGRGKGGRSLSRSGGKN